MREDDQDPASGKWETGFGYLAIAYAIYEHRYRVAEFQEVVCQVPGNPSRGVPIGDNGSRYQIPYLCSGGWC